MWHWLVTQGVVSGVLVTWIGMASPAAIGGWIWHRISERRHRERLAATAQLTAALTRPEED